MTKRQTDRQTGRQAGRQTDRQTETEGSSPRDKTTGNRSFSPLTTETAGSEGTE